jgi:hypothetical protein
MRRARLATPLDTKRRGRQTSFFQQPLRYAPRRLFGFTQNDPARTRLPFDLFIMKTSSGQTKWCDCAKPAALTVLCSVILFVCGALSSLDAAPVTVGTKGNEPLLAIAPDGTLYISALQHIYRSTNSGASWTELPGPVFASQLNLNSDSSIAVDPGGRLYFTFDYPYAGTTAVCTSDDKGDTWFCNPAVVPGGTDRMWVLAPSNTAAYEVTNEGLYETTFLASTDRGTTWTPSAVGTGILEPQTGPLLQKKCSSSVLQVAKIYGNSDAEAQVQIYVYAPSSPGAVLSEMRPTGLKLPTALPSAALGLDGTLYVSSEEVNAAGGRQVVVARSGDEGKTWTKLPPLPSTTTGTATFTWVAAGAPGHVGVIYYYTTDNGDAGTLTNSTWSVVWAESFNADTASPAWTVTTIEQPIHKGRICVAADCMGTDRFAGDFINAIIDPAGAAHLTWMKQEDGTGATSIRYTKIVAGPVSTYTSAPCSAATPTPTPTASSTPTPTASPTPTATPSPSGTPASVQLLNVSGRLLTQASDKVGIGGFIIQGSDFKRVIVRAIGPSLKVNGNPVPGALQDPILELHDDSGGVITNDNWRSTQESDIQQTGLAPSDDRESAILTTLRRGAYTAIIRGANGTTGIGLVEIYDLQSTNSSELGNLSVRADVRNDDNVLIDGLIIRGGTPKRVLLRAIGPTLHNSGVAGELRDPVLELHDGNGTLMTMNDNWKEASNAAEIQATGLAPTDDRESAILMTLSSGNYTAVVSGVNRTTGIALAEAYKLD